MDILRQLIQYIRFHMPSSKIDLEVMELLSAVEVRESRNLNLQKDCATTPESSEQNPSGMQVTLSLRPASVVESQGDLHPPEDRELVESAVLDPFVSEVEPVQILILNEALSTSADTQSALDVAVGVPADVTADVPVGEAVDMTADVPAGVPPGAAAYVAAGVPTDVPAVLVVHVPAGLPADMAVAATGNLATDVPAVLPSGVTTGVGADVPADEAAGGAADVTADVPAGVPACEAADVPADVPSDVTADETANMPAAVAGHVAADVATETSASRHLFLPAVVHLGGPEILFPLPEVDI